MLPDSSKELGETLFRLAKEYSAGSVRYLRDKQKSFGAFLGSHECGNSKGTFGLALAYFEGNGPTKDRQKAESLVAGIIPAVEQRAEEGDPEYQLILGDMYSFGLGKNIDHGRAFSLYMLAAGQGNLEAQCNLGYAYFVGQGVEPDIRQTVYWWILSAEAGHPHSCRDIGECYLNGRGLPRDPATAIRWFEKASELNYSHGTSDLAYCHLFGVGVERNPVRAAELYHLAFSQDHDRTLRDLLAANIDVDIFLSEGRIVVNEIRAVTEVPPAEYQHGRYFVRSSVEELDPGAFTQCETLYKFLVDNRNPNFRCIDGVLYNGDRTELVRYPNGMDVTEFVCPPFVKRIGPKAFQNARRLLRVVLDDTLVAIGESAFDDCKSLVHIDFPDALASIGPWAFHGCDNLAELHLPASLGSIGEYAFGSCEALSLIEVDPANPRYSTQNGCLFDQERRHLLQYPIGRKVRCCEVPRTVEVIGFRSFSDAYHLEAVVLGERVVEVCDKAFYYATKLQRVHFRGPPVARLGKQVFDRTHPDLQIVVPGGLLRAYQTDERFGGLPMSAES